MSLHDSHVLNAYLQILRLLNENAIVGETEGEVLDRISEETRIKLKKVRKRVAEMLDEGLIARRTAPVRFELTKSGQEYLRDPKEGQRVIDEKWIEIMRKTQRRILGSEAMQEFVAVEEKWENVAIPDKQKIEDIRKTASYLRTETSDRSIVTTGLCEITSSRSILPKANFSSTIARVKNGEYSLTPVMVARERFELSSAGPEPAMFDHCTTGLVYVK